MFTNWQVGGLFRCHVPNYSLYLRIGPPRIQARTRIPLTLKPAAGGQRQQAGAVFLYLSARREERSAHAARDLALGAGFGLWRRRRR